MKKLITLISLLALLSISFVSCEKDNEDGASNYIKIEGTFMVGNKEYTNPTFDLGEPEDHEGFLLNFAKDDYNGIRIVPVSEFYLENNSYLFYRMDIYSATVGSAEMYCTIQISDYTNTKVSGLNITSEHAAVKITKVGTVGEYIEGTYEGDFYEPGKTEIAPYHIKGKFKVKRIESPYNK